jgi:flagellar P-ring protein FlgI
MKHKTIILRSVLLLAVLAGLALPVSAERVKDITTIKGERSNQLHGVGLVVGLDGTGDNSAVTRRLLTSYYRRQNMAFDPANVDAANAAAVIVTAHLGPFDRNGSTIDVTVSTTGGAGSLQGGTLVMTPLHGADGRVYAVAQGSIILGGFGASGNNAAIIQGHLTSGAIPDGATVEREEIAKIVENGEVTLLLKNPDHTTAQDVAAVVNNRWPGTAHAADAGTIHIALPFQKKTFKRGDVNQFLSEIGHLQVKVDQPAVVVINEKTGTVIVGQNVTISTVAIAHGNLTITTEEKNYVVQPGPFSGDNATTQQEQRTSIKASTGSGRLHVVPKQLTVTQLAQALNQMGLTPRDMIAIFQALKRAGALQAELRTM